MPYQDWYAQAAQGGDAIASRGQPPAPGAAGAGAMSLRSSIAGASPVQGGGYGAGAPTQQQWNPYDLGQSFARFYGGRPTHQIVSAMQEGQDINPATTPNVGVAQAPVGSPTPAQAGANNAAMPGMYGGAQDTGIPGQEAGMMPRRRPGGHPMAPPSGATPGMVQPTGAPYAPPGTTKDQPSNMESMPTVAPPAPAPTPPAQDPYQATAQPAPYQPPTLPTPAIGGTNTPQVTTALPGTPATESKSAMATGAPAAKDAPAYTALGVAVTQAKPPNWDQWSTARRKQWVDAHRVPTTPTGGTTHPGDTTTPGGTTTPGDGTGAGTGTTTPGTGTTGATDTPGTGTPGATGGDGNVVTHSGRAKFSQTIKNHSLFYELIGHKFEPSNDPNVVHHFDETTSAAGNWQYVAGDSETNADGTPAGHYGQFNDAGFWNRQGTFRTWDSDSANWENFTSAGFDPAAFMGANPDRALSGKDFFRYGLGLTQQQIEQFNPLPPPSSFQDAHTFSGTEPPQDMFDIGSPNFVPNAGVRDLVTRSFKLANDLQQAWAQPSDTRNLKTIKDLTDQLELGRLALSLYGISYDPKPGDPATGTPPGQYNTDQYNTDPHAPATDHAGISTGQIDRTLAGDSLDARAARLEAESQLDAANIGFANQGKNAALWKEGLDLMRSDPYRSQAEQIATSIGQTPDPTDWETIKNKAVSTTRADLSSGLGQLSTDLNRRGVGATGGAGIAGDIYRRSSNDVANRLGDLDIQQSQAKRAGELQALDALGSTYDRYTGGEIRQLQGLGSVIGGQTPVPFNPASGLASTAVGLTQLNEAGQPTGPTATQGALSGAVAGAGAGASLGPYGALFGALLGGAGGYYSASQAR